MNVRRCHLRPKGGGRGTLPLGARSTTTETPGLLFALRVSVVCGRGDVVTRSATGAAGAVLGRVGVEGVAPLAEGRCSEPWGRPPGEGPAVGPPVGRGPLVALSARGPGP